MTPYLVPCLVQLRAQFDHEFPTRDKGADGWIADGAHSSSSDHQPNAQGAVRAIDIDVDLNRPGISLWQVCEMLRGHSGLEYIIHNRQIASRSFGWTWRAYAGSDPHTNHAHFSARHDGFGWSSTATWGLEDIMVKDEFMQWMDEWAAGARMPGHVTNLDTGVKTSVKRSLAGTLDALVAVDLQDAPGGPSTSLVGRNALNQGIPNPIAGRKTPTWKLLEDIADAVTPAPE